MVSTLYFFNVWEKAIIYHLLQDKLDKVEERVEEQEQYSRRTSLRFNNVRVPTNSNGDIIQPIDTDSIVLQICKNQLGVKLNLISEWV
jgi:hypothetical protein